MDINKDIYTIVDRHCASNFHRVINPLRELGYKDENFLTSDNLQRLSEAKVFFANSFRVEDLIKFQNLRRMGIKIVLDIDDYWNVDPTHYYYHQQRQSDSANKIIAGVMNCDAVITTNEFLAYELKKYNPNVHIIPNALRFDSGQFTESHNFDRDKVRFGYLGGFYEMDKAHLLKSAFEDLNKEDLNFTVTVSGMQEDKVEWLEFEKRFTLDGTLKYYNRTLAKSLDTYMQHYENLDVSLVPLLNNKFNFYKSNLKLLEAGAKYLTCICSSVNPYTHRSPEGVLYATSPTEWYSGIKSMSKSHWTRRHLGICLGEWVREHFHLDKHNIYRRQLLEYYAG